MSATRRLLEKTCAIAADYVEALPGRHAGATEDMTSLVKRLGGPLPAEPSDPELVIRELAHAMAPGLIASAGPRYFGFVIGGAHPVATAADWLCSAWDQNAQAFASSPAAAAVETVTAEWLLEIFGLPRSASVGFVTGGQMATFTCLAAAQLAVLHRDGWDVRERGLRGSPPLKVLIGEDCHVTVRAALAMIGIGERDLTIVPTDAQGRIELAAFARAVEIDADIATIACAQLGQVNTGASDDIAALAAQIVGRNAWLHVDGAFGLWALASDALRPSGVEHASSWSVDAHKWLNVPYDSGMAIVANQDAHRAAMDARCAYVGQVSTEHRDGMSWVPENSRRARAVPIYAALRALGRRGVADLVERSCARARRLAEKLASDRSVEVLNDVVLNQVLFRAVDRDAARVAQHVQRDGTCWIGTSVWRGREVLRASVCNWSTSEEDIDRSAAAILEAIART